MTNSSNVKKEEKRVNSKLLLKSVFVILALSGTTGCARKDEKPAIVQPNLPVAVTKTNAMKIYMHYMPWFQSKAVSGYWGSHWTMTNRNPDIIDPNGQREIASNFYPLIGPYDSKDKDVIDYHLLLLKYAGVDAILFDWYGTSSVNDYAINLNNTNTVISRLDTVGVQFGIVYEEYVAQYSASPIIAAQTDLSYVQTNYWSKKSHIRDAENVPILLTFGPRYFKSPSQWDEIFSSITTKPRFLPLWNLSNLVGNSATGEFSWIDFSAGQTGMPPFYQRIKSAGWPFGIGSAFPRYDDYYVQGGEGPSYGYVDFNNGETLKNTLAQATEGGVDYLQCVTWNDFGEGTIFEPTAENQFTCLEILQQFTGVTYGQAELQLIYNYYQKKVQYKNDASKAKVLAQVFHALTSLNVSEATSLMTTIP
jgi:glycoprotein endo-alpha-1,2-mannosidase